MALTTTQSSLTPAKRTTRLRALSDIQFNTILSGYQATSSEDEATEGHTDIHAIGVSIGRQQTHLTSPTTPAAEKAAAIDAAGGFFGDAFDDAQASSRVAKQSQGLGVRAPTDDGDSSVLTPLSPPETQPSRRSSQTKATLRDGFLSSRRSSSGSESGARGQSRGLLAVLPSLPKRLSIRNPFSHGLDAPVESPEVVQERVKNFTNHHVASELPPTSSGAMLQSPTLRRTASDTSLTLQREGTRISFGDDSRFENVHEQVNSRVKAIKDSYRDAGFKVRFPSISNISVASLAPDFLRDHIPGSRDTEGDKPRDSVDPFDSKAEDPHVSKSTKPVDPYTRSPYHSAKAALHDAPPHKSSANHPNFTRALEQLEGDIVVLGGYRGSILRSAEPPHRQVWVPIKVGLNLRKVDLEVGLDEDADERAPETIIPDGMLSHIGPVDVSRRLFKRLRACENARNGTLRVHDYGYDWRLNPSHLSSQLVKFLAGLPNNQKGTPRSERGVIVVAHSLGGLITRHAVNQRPELFRGVIYAGTPRTCVNILGPLRNGDDVLLSSRVLTAQVNFTIRTSFALLPLNGRCFFDKDTKEEYPVDFFDPQTWIDYRLSPCIARPLPPLNPPPSKPTGLLSEYVNAVTSALPLPRRKSSVSKSPLPDPSRATMGTANTAAEPDSMNNNVTSNSTTTTAHTQTDGMDPAAEEAVSISTAVTLPRDQCLEYLTRTLASVKHFKQALTFHPPHQAANLYPPTAVLYGKSQPTVFGAKVSGREGILRSDAYDDLAFASGDGVVLARAAMVPDDYKVVPRGIVSSERGHITLLGDLDAVGRCLCAIIDARKTSETGLGRLENEK